MPSASEPGLSQAECRKLQHIAGVLVPPSEEYQVPGADDAVIFADIVRSIGRDLADVQTALATLDSLAGGAFADLGAARHDAVVQGFFEPGGPAAAALSRVILQCYYRDDRVLRSLGHEPRPPFPKGHTLEQGDWSLLDAVRGRPKLWRDAP